MKSHFLSALAAGLVAGSLALMGCGGADDAADDTSASSSGAVAATQGDAQTPPTGTPETIRAWIEGGDYLKWSCEDNAHAARTRSPHGENRICSNALLSGHGGAGEYPVGAAAVKEIMKSGAIIGYAMYQKVASGDGASWYWYEDVEGLGLVANSRGDEGKAKSVCVSCHSGASNDFVYTQVK